MAKLGDIRNDKTGIFKHREWRGLSDTLYDYVCWMGIWKDLIIFVGKAPITTVKAIFRYRWMSTYLKTPEFLDRMFFGLRGTQLRVGRMHFKMVVKNLIEYLELTFKADLNLNPNNKIHDKIIYIDELLPSLLFRGFNESKVILTQLAPVYLPSFIDQYASMHYINATETYGVPADVCPLPSCEAGVAIEDDYPRLGKCFISSNMPCDGSAMTSSFQDRRFNLPTYPLNTPLRYNEPDAEEYAVGELKECIAFMEEQLGEKFDWEKLRKHCEIYNQQIKYELEKWEVNRTEYPIVTASNLWVYHIYYFHAGTGDANFLKTDKKVNALMNKAYEKREVCSKTSRHRAIAWNSPANFYADFNQWLENCWGVVTLLDMLGATGTTMIDTTTNDTMLAGVAKLYQNVSMRKHTKGGYVHVLDQLWKEVEHYNADMVIMYDQISCKGMDGLLGLFEDQARERGIKLMWVKQDLLDPTTISRRGMREQVNAYMSTVMNEKPIDESLLDFDDSLSW